MMIQYRQAVPIVSTLLILLSAWLAASLVWQVMALWRPVDVSVSVTPDAQAVAGPGYNLQTLLSVPLFGEKPAQTAEAVPAAEVIRTSTLRIRLLGVVAGVDGEGVAILQHDGKEYAYKVGDKLDLRESVELVAVRHDHVVIARGGGHERIEMSPDSATAGGLRRVSSPTPSGSGTSDERTVDLTDASIRSLVGDPRQTLQQNPLRLMRYLSVSPHVEDGKTVGFVVSAGQDRRLLPRLGLEPGDIVVAVNDQALGEVAISDLLTSLDTTDSFELKVLRNGQQQTIRLNL